MNEPRFRGLEDALIRHGVAVRHARRAVREMEGHHRQLVEDALARGETPEEAARSAHEALGTDEELIDRFVSRKELLSWSHRWPAGYALTPIATFLGLAIAGMAVLVLLANAMSGSLHRIPLLSRSVTADINFAMNVAFLWILPLGTALGFGILARRRRVPLRWPLIGILVLCLVVAMINLKVIVTGGPHSGYASAGIGTGSRQLPIQLLHAFGKAALVLTALAWLTHRARSKHSVA